jgi:hypothetical protein
MTSARSTAHAGTTLRPGMKKLAVLVCGALFGVPLEAQRGTLPQELLHVARQRHCDEVQEFYARPGLLHPPFVFGIDGGDEQESAAFWCQLEGSRTFALVLLRADGRQALLAWSNFPGGLSVTATQDVDLSRFRLLTHPDSLGPGVVLRGVRAIRSYYDGKTELFVEYHGRWWVRMDD